MSKTEKYEEKLAKIGLKITGLRKTLRGGLGMPQTSFRERITKAVEERTKPSKEGSQRPLQGLNQKGGGFLEKFQSRDRPILGKFLNRESESQQPENQLTQEEKIILGERQTRILEDAEARQLQEEKDLIEAEKAKIRKRARSKMSINT